MKKRVKKSNKSGQSGILTTVLIILLVLVAIIILWNIVMPMIQESSQDIDVNPLTNTVSIESFRLYLNGDVNIRVKRDSGDQNIDSMQIVFYDVNGGRYVKTINNPPKAGEIILYTIKASDIKANDKLNRVGVIPIINDKDGLEAKDISVVKKDSSGNIIPEIPANPGDIGLVSYWKFDGDYRDSAGENDGSCSLGISCPNLTTDNKGNANSSYSFDGDGDYVSVGSDAGVSNGITVSAWINSNNPTGTIASIVSQYGGDYNGWYLVVYEGSYLLFNIGNGTVVKTPLKGGISQNKWYHVVGVYNGSVGTVYINGVAGTGVSLFNMASRTDLALTIGKANWFGGYDFNGSIDNVMIFNKSLSEYEVKALYNNQK